MEDNVAFDVQRRYGYRTRNALATSIGRLDKRRGVRRKAANSRKNCAFYGTLQENQRRKVFYLNPQTESWQKVSCALPVMPSIPTEWFRHLMPTGDAFIFAPHHWIVEAKSNGVVEVSLWLYMVAFVQGEIQSVQAREWTIACDYPHGKVEAWPMALLRERTNGWLLSFACSASRLYTEMIGASSVEIPTVVIEAAISFMQDFAKREFGFRPTCPGNIHGLRHMISFCYRPLDLNIHLFRNVIGETYEQLFPRNQRDNYRSLCRFLQLEHPPKSLRKAYNDSPENIVAFVLLRQLGFRDINIIRRFFYREELFGFRLLKLSYNPVIQRLEDGGHQHWNPYLAWLERFCRWFLRHSNEACLGERLIGEWNDNATDILRMFVFFDLDRNEAALQPGTIRRLLREGLTRRVHDEMAHELEAIIPREEGRYSWGPLPNVVISYTNEERKYEDNIDGYQFLLPKDTDALNEYGRCFHNCVASYRDNVLEKRSLIFAMKRKEKYIACIEVRQRRVVQAKGPCNQELSADVMEVLRKWAAKK